MKCFQMNKKQIFFIILTIFITGFIFYNSSQDAADSSRSSGYFVNFIMWCLNKTGFSISRDTITFLIRKAAHITEFASQSLSFCGIVLNSGKKIKNYVFTIMFTGLFTACIDEFIQLSSMGRSGQVTDIFVDFFGTLTGIALLMVFTLLKNKIELKIKMK